MTPSPSPPPSESEPMPLPPTEESQQAAAQCWCDPETEHLVMQPELCIAFARRLDAWMETAAQAYRNEEFWRNLTRETGRILGGRVYVQDDGGIVDEPLGLRVPEVAKELKEALAQSTAALAAVMEPLDRFLRSTPDYCIPVKSHMDELRAVTASPDKAAAEMVERVRKAEAGREALAQWMIKRSYATGHGDTIQDLLGELETQYQERVDDVEADFKEAQQYRLQEMKRAEKAEANLAAMTDKWEKTNRLLVEYEINAGPLHTRAEAAEAACRFKDTTNKALQDENIGQLPLKARIADLEAQVERLQATQRTPGTVEICSGCDGHKHFWNKCPSPTCPLKVRPASEEKYSG